MITGTSPPKTLNNSCLIIKPTLAAFSSCGYKTFPD
jgi:hypothetical protein